MFTFLASTITVIAFVSFIGVVCWAFSARNRARFTEAANLPFVSPEDGGEH